jgi:hypothetical protein
MWSNAEDIAKVTNKPAYQGGGEMIKDRNRDAGLLINLKPERRMLLVESF